MKILFIITLDCVFVFGFFLLGYQKNKKLAHQLDQVESVIASKQEVQDVVENFKTEQKQIIEQNRSVAELESKKYQTTDFLFNFIQELPQGISLIQFTKLDNGFFISGEASSKKLLKTFLNTHHLRLTKLKRLLFEASGNI